MLKEERRATHDVVVPVENRSQLEVGEAVVLEPLAKEVLLDARLGGEDGHRDRSLGDGRSVRLGRDDESTRESLVSDHLLSEELGESFGGRDRSRLLRSVLGERLGHAAVLGDELDEFVVREAGGLGKEDVEPLVGNGGDRGVALLEVRSEEELLEDLGLERLDELELSAPLDLESLELGEAAVRVEDGVPLLEELVLLLRRREDHRAVRSVELEEDRVLLADFVRPSRRVDELVVLVVGEVLVDEVVEHRAGVRDPVGLAASELEIEAVGESAGQHAPNPVRVELERSADLFDNLQRSTRQLRRTKAESCYEPCAPSE